MSYFRSSDFESLREIDMVTSSFKDTGEEETSESIEDGMFAQVDKLLEGIDSDKEKAFDILQRIRNKVILFLETIQFIIIKIDLYCSNVSICVYYEYTTDSTFISVLKQTAK